MLYCQWKGFTFGNLFSTINFSDHEILLITPTPQGTKWAKPYAISLPLLFFFYYLLFYFFNFCVLFFFPSYKNRGQHTLTSLLTLRQYFPHFGTQKFRKEDCPQYSGSQEGKTIPFLSRFKTEDILLCCLILIYL